MWAVNVLEFRCFRELDELMGPVARRDERGCLLMCRRCSMWGHCTWPRREGPHQRVMFIVRGSSRRKLLIH